MVEINFSFIQLFCIVCNVLSFAVKRFRAQKRQRLGFKLYGRVLERLIVVQTCVRLL
jgi:hypothetical protein